MKIDVFEEYGCRTSIRGQKVSKNGPKLEVQRRPKRHLKVIKNGMRFSIGFWTGGRGPWREDTTPGEGKVSVPAAGGRTTGGGKSVPET